MPAAREFELLPLWFWVVEVVSSELWLPNPPATEALVAFTKALHFASGAEWRNASLWDSLAKDGDGPQQLQLPGMQLAARAVLLFLGHVMLAKKKGLLQARPLAVRFGSASSELRAQAGALLRCAAQPPFNAQDQGFQGFFSVLELLLRRTPPVTLGVYRKEVVRCLLPMAPCAPRCFRTRAPPASTLLPPRLCAAPPVLVCRPAPSRRQVLARNVKWPRVPPVVAVEEQ